MEIKRWDVGPSTFLVLPEKGARLLNWHVNMGDGSVRDVIYWPESINEEDLSKVHGGIPVLFPFCGTSFFKVKRKPGVHKMETPIHAPAWICQGCSFRYGPWISQDLK